MEKEQISRNASVFEEKSDEFRDVLSSVIEQVLIGTLGKSGAQTTYHCLEEKYQLRKETIPESLERFHISMMQIFGPGTLLIEEYIMEKLHAILFHEHKDFMSKDENKGQLNFPIYVQNLKTVYMCEGEI